jgi:S-(hydroxymethyl)glutathione dehydrogenase/alcohol dehydrogenase
VRRAIRKITGLGVHVAIEALGTTPTIQTAWEILRPGGLALIIGMLAASEKIPLRAAGFFVERRIAGVVYGRADSRRDLPILFEHVRSGALQLDPLVTDELRLEDAQAALDALASGRGARNVIVHAR